MGAGREYQVRTAKVGPPYVPQQARRRKTKSVRGEVRRLRAQEGPPTHEPPSTRRIAGSNGTGWALQVPQVLCSRLAQPVAMLVSGGAKPGAGGGEATLEDFTDLTAVLAALPDLGSDSPATGFANLLSPSRAVQAGEVKLPASVADFGSPDGVAFLPAGVAAFAESLNTAARTAVAHALDSAESLAFDGAEFSRFRAAQLSLTEPSAATLQRLGLTGCYGVVGSPPPLNKDAAVELLQNAWASALGELGGLATTAAAARTDATTALEGAAAAAGAAFSASAAAAAGQLRTATEASGEDWRSAVLEAASIGHAHASAAATAMRNAASAELSAVAAQASTVATALANESAALEQDVALRASEALARGTGMAEVALEEAATSAAAVLSAAGPVQRLAAEADAATLFANDVLDRLPEWSDDFLDVQISLAAASDAAFSQAAARASATAAEVRRLAGDAMETTAGVLGSAQDSSLESFVNSLLAGSSEEARPQ